MTPLQIFSRRTADRWIAASLWLAVVVSALLLVSVSQQCRQLYASLAMLQQDANQMQVEWGQYLLEQSSWASFSRIEQRAASELGMVVPSADSIVLVKP